MKSKVLLIQLLLIFLLLNCTTVRFNKRYKSVEVNEIIIKPPLVKIEYKEAFEKNNDSGLKFEATRNFYRYFKENENDVNYLFATKDLKNMEKSNISSIISFAKFNTENNEEIPSSLLAGFNSSDRFYLLTRQDGRQITLGASIKEASIKEAFITVFFNVLFGQNTHPNTENSFSNMEFALIDIKRRKSVFYYSDHDNGEPNKKGTIFDQLDSLQEKLREEVLLKPIVSLDTKS